MNLNSPKIKKIALFVVIFVLLPLISFFLLNLNFQKHNEERQNRIKSIQAEFGAIAAEQHFKTKIKYFPTEFYNALEISLGKNPLFDFTEYEAQTEDKKNFFTKSKFSDSIFIRQLPKLEYNMFKEPKYYYMKLPNKNAFIKIGNFIASDYRFLLLNSYSDNPNEKYVYPKQPSSNYYADKYLLYYIRDCTNFTVLNLHSALNIQKKVNSPDSCNFDINKDSGYPYSMEYSIKKVDVVQTENIKSKGEEYANVRAEGIMINNALTVHSKSKEFIVKVNTFSYIR